ncbi:MAG: porphobilinogen deaminase [bacterium]|nr:MAG: porphobilinogen deaminase [bacterium]
MKCHFCRDAWPCVSTEVTSHKSMEITMTKRNITIATRGSELALIQSNYVKDWIEKRHKDLGVHLNIIKTTGDKILDSPLSQVGEKGLFVKEIEESLISGESDLAVHSMKDVLTTLPDGLHIVAVGEREDPRDVLISNRYSQLSELPEAARIGTSSLRRKVQLLHHYPKLEIVDIRGNLNTRLKKLESEKMDGIILAAAGVKRMGWTDRTSEYIDPGVCIPAVSQGAIGIECRLEDDFINRILKPFNHYRTQVCLTAERSFMRRLEGGCQVPIGGYTHLEGDQLIMDGMVASLDGKVMLIEQMTASLDEANDLGIRIADKLIERGANKILGEIRDSS